MKCNYFDSNAHLDRSISCSIEKMAKLRKVFQILQYSPNSLQMFKPNMVSNTKVLKAFMKICAQNSFWIFYFKEFSNKCWIFGISGFHGHDGIFPINKWWKIHHNWNWGTPLLRIYICFTTSCLMFCLDIIKAWRLHSIS